MKLFTRVRTPKECQRPSSPHFLISYLHFLRHHDHELDDGHCPQDHWVHYPSEPQNGDFVQVCDNPKWPEYRKGQIAP